MFEKISKLASTKKYQLILVTVLIIALVIALAEYGFKLYDQQPVGTNQVTSFKGKRIIDGYPRRKGPEPFTTAKNKQGITYPFLFETKIKTNHIAAKKLAEFPNGHNYLTNETALIATADPSQIKAVNQMWQKNSANYNFNQPDNRFAAGIGEDSAQMTRYLEEAKPSAWTSSWINRWDNAVWSARTPISQAVFGLLTDGSIKANLDLAGDSYYVPVQGTLSFGGISQYTAISGTQKAPKVITPDGNKNIVKTMLRNSNSVYQIQFDQNLQGVNYTFYAYVREYGSGTLKLLGYWYDAKGSLPESVTPFGQFASATKEALSIASSNSDNDHVVSWSEFYEAFK